MKQYTHDYTLPSLAESLLQTADEAIRLEDYDKALKLINDARQTLQQYLSRDNMVEDGDVENGWIHYNDAARELEDARKLNEHYLETMLAMGKTSMAVVGISERNLAELEELRSREKTGPKIVRHGKIDRQYKQQLDGVGDVSCPLYGKHIRISGTFEQIQMTRDDVAAACQRLGAKQVSEGIAKSMDIVILGNNAGPAKMEKIRLWQSEGHQIETLSQFDIKKIFDEYLPVK